MEHRQTSPFREIAQRTTLSAASSTQADDMRRILQARIRRQRQELVILHEELSRARLECKAAKEHAERLGANNFRLGRALSTLRAILQVSV